MNEYRILNLDTINCGINGQKKFLINCKHYFTYLIIIFIQKNTFLLYFRTSHSLNLYGIDMIN